MWMCQYVDSFSASFWSYEPRHPLDFGHHQPMTYEVSIQGTAIEKVTEDQQAVLGGEQGAGTFSDQIFVKKMMWQKLTTPPEMFPY